MKEEQDNISQFFDKRLSNRGFAFDEAQWDALEARLDEEEAAGLLIYQGPWYLRNLKPLLWGVLLILFILLLGWYFRFNNVGVNNSAENLIQLDKASIAVNECEEEFDQGQDTNLREQRSLVTTASSEDEACVEEEFDALIEINSKSDAYTSSQVRGSQNFDKTSVKTKSHDTDNIVFANAKKEDESVDTDFSVNTKDPFQNNLSTINDNSQSGSSYKEAPIFLDSGELLGRSTSLQTLDNIQYVLFPLEISMPTIVFSETKPETDKKHEMHSKWAIMLFVAPDFNSTSYQELYKNIGEAIGLAVEYHIVERFSVDIGVALDHKVYTAHQGDYTPIKGFWTGGIVPDATDAKCLVLDIPVNIGYRLLKINKHEFWFNTGVSSYWMLTEDYQYVYHTPSPEARQQWTGERESFHFSGALDISVTYERQLTRHFSILLQPYLRNPLKGIGHGSVELLSSGVNFGLKYHFFKKN